VPNVVVVGAQWGDEGKGKVVDQLAARSRWVVRYQGGNNAGHTLVVGGERVILHLVPSGVLQPGCTCVIGNGVVVDPGVLARELDGLAARGRAVDPSRLMVSAEAHLILPGHRAIDAAREATLGEQRIGTTGRGIGPAYEDKVARRGIRTAALLEPRLDEVVRGATVVHNRRLAELEAPPLDVDAAVAEVRTAATRIAPFVRSAAPVLHAAWRRGDAILFEGAQGTFLDVDHGTYPFVTSSNTVAGAACAGAGVGPTAIDEVVGIAKAYATRVGSGPFPTELPAAEAALLRERGQEFGATTGRPRRCGWFDAAMVRHAAMVNGMTRLALTKLDVLSGFGGLRIATGYAGIDDVPTSADGLARVRPAYEELAGWEGDLSACRRWSDLPWECRRYVERIEELVGVPVGLLGTGPGRESAIVRDPLFAP
jgi:adenylosuccinate synthase